MENPILVMMFSTGTLLRALFEKCWVIGASLAVLTGCGLVDNTLRGTLGVPGFFSVDAEHDFLTVDEGFGLSIAFLLSDEAPEDVLAEWEILGGAGEFDVHQGTLTIPKSAKGVQIPTINAKTDDKLDGNVNYTLVLTSKRFKNKGKKLEIIIRVIDKTTPAKLVFSSAPEFEFTATLVDHVRPGLITVTNEGDATAEEMSFSALTAPFRYAGGSFPGTGGTCSTSLAGHNQSCTLALEFAPTGEGTFTGSISVGYKDYKNQQSSALNLKGVAAEVVAELANVPSDPSNAQSLNITVGGDGITHYRYKLGDSDLDCSDLGSYSGNREVDDHITNNLSLYSDLRLRLCVVGGKELSPGVFLWQPEATATVYEWMRDRTAPVLTAFTIDGGALYSTTPEVSLQIDGSDTYSTKPNLEMFISNSDTCTSGADEDYVPFAADVPAWMLSAGDGDKDVTVRIRDEAGNDSTTCLTATIFLDTVPPEAPTGLAIGSTPFSLGETPILTFTDASDPDPASGTDFHEARLLHSDGTEMATWKAFESGDHFDGLSLVEGEEYRIEVRGVDVAGNEGDVASSSTWIASGPVVATISGEPEGLNNQTALDVTIGGGNITGYRYKIGEGAGFDCSDSSDYIPALPGEDVGTKITDSFSVLDDGVIKLCVVGTNNILWQPFGQATSVTWTKDTTPPGAPSIVINTVTGYTNDDEVGLTLSATDVHEMYITNTAGCSAGGTWEPFSASVDPWPLAQANTTATVYAAFRDTLGNTTSCESDSIVHDDLDPNNPTSLALGPVPPSMTDTPVITFLDATDNGSDPSGVERYQIQILNQDGSELAGWQDFESGDQVSGLTLEDGAIYYAKIRAIDHAGNISSGADTAPWTVAGELIATISGEPSDPSKDTVLDVTIGGTNISHYRYKIAETDNITCTDGSGYLPAEPGTAIGTKITQDFSSLDDGSITLCVIGSNGSEWQDLSNASSETWVKDTLAPQGPSIAINGVSAYTNNDEVTLTLDATDLLAIEVYVTNASDCLSGGNWEAFSSSMAWTLGQTNSTAHVYAAFKDAVGNTTACVSDDIIHDAQNPNDPTNLALGFIPASLESTPVITFTDATDVGPADINRHEIQIYKADDTLLKDWESFTSGSSVTGLILEDGEQYYAKIRAVDNATNVSAGVDTATWTVAGALMATISGEPTGSNTDTVLDVTIGGTNITHYRYKIAETGSVDCEVASGYQPAAPGTAIGTKITEDFSSLDDGSITLCVIGSNGSEWQDLATPTSVTWVKDVAAPTGLTISINSDAAYTNDDEVTLTLSATDDHAIQMYVTNVSDCSSGGSWEAYNTTKSWTLGQINSTATVYVAFKDQLENTTSCIGDSITHDAQDPNDPTGLSLGTIPPSLSSTPLITFTDATDVGPADINRHEIQIHRADNSVLQGWQPFTSGDAVTGLTLIDGQQYYAKIRAVDNATNVSEGVNTAPWTVAGALMATISDEPASPSNDTVLDVTIGGTNITHYRYKIAETGSINCTSAAGYQPAEPGTAIGTKITHDFALLDDGSITLCVIGSNGSEWQNLATPTSATWVKDTTPPQNLVFEINSDEAYTVDTDVSLTISADDATQMYITNTAGCTAGGSWESYATSVSSWTLAQDNATATVYIAFSDALGNTTACISDTIIHDDSNPNAPSNIILGATPPSVTNSPSLTFTDNGDQGPAGINRFEVEIYDAADDSVVEEWQPHISGQQVTGLSLDDGEQYYAKIRAVDNAGNISAEATSGAWTVAGALIAVINDEPASPSSDTVLDVTISGTNISYYRYKIAETDSITCTNSAGYQPAAPGTAVGTKITQDFSLLDDGSVTLCVIGSNGSEWQALADATSKTWVKDTLEPQSISISINSDAAYTNNDDVTLTLGATDPLAVEMYVTNTAGCTSGGDWDAFSSSMAWTLGQINTSATVYVAFRDSVGNTTSCISDSITHDAQDPNNPTGLSLGSIPPSTTTTPVITFTNATDVGPADINRHEIQIHRADNSVLQSWQTFTSGNAVTGLSLIDGEQYYAKIRAVDNATNVSSGVDTATWTVAGALMATISGEPTGSNTDTVLDVTIGGTNINHYRYKIGETSGINCTDSAGYLPAAPGTAVGTKITQDFSSLDDGSITLCVIGSNGSEWQDLATPTSVTWVKDVAAPTGITISINSDALYTNDDDVTLTLSATDDHAIQMYVTNVNDCSSGGSWEAYSTTKSWTLGQINSTATVYVAFKDQLENTTGCISDSITHDAQDPNDPTGLILGSIPPSTTTTPLITFTDAIDVGPANINRHEIQIHRADNTVLKAWETFTSGSSVTGLSLIDGEQYYAKIRAVDNATNVSDGVNTATWTVAGALMATISGEPTGSNTDTVLDVTISGTNITHYRYKIDETGSIDCTSAAGYQPAAPGTAVGTKITEDFSSLDDGSITLCVIGSNGSEWQDLSTPTSVTWVKDVTAPTGLTISINSDALYTNDDDVTLTLSATDDHSIQMYVTNVNDCSSGGSWEAYNATKSWTLGQINTTATVYVAFKDTLENTSSCISDSITHDAQDPNDPTGLSLGTIPPSLIATPVITFTDATDVGPAGLDKHQVQIHLASNHSVVSSWQDFESGNSVAVILMNGEQYYAKIRAVDNATNVSSGVNTATWTVAGALTATISGAPASPSNDTVLDVTIGGTNITHYRYKIAETGSINCTSATDYQPAEPGTAIGTKITHDFEDLDDGSITLCVIGSNGSEWQNLATPTSATWVKDTTPPQNLVFEINSDEAYTVDTEVSLTISADDATQMYITNTAGCTTGGIWESYATSVSSWTLAQDNATATVYIAFRDALENTTACISDTIIHDDSNPNAPSDILLGATPPSVTNSPSISFTDNLDVGPAGINRFEVEIYDAADDSVVEEWQPHISGQQVTGLSLDDGEQYYAKIRAVDNAGNISVEATSGTWTVAGALIAVINDEPASPSNDTVLDVTISGTNISYYRYKIGETDSITCTDSAGYQPAAPGTAVGTKITQDFSSLDDGSVTLCVIGSNGAQWQDLSSATSKTWIKDTQAPQGPSIAINAGATYTTQTGVTLTLTATDSLPVQMYVTNTAGCASGGNWDTFSPSMGWTLGQINSTATVYVAFRDSVGNTTSCESDTIVHDAQDPNNPTGLALGSIPPSTTATPVITFTSAGDVGPSGINRHEIQIHRADNSVLQAWQTFTSGNAVTGLSLIDGQQYYAKIRAVDNASNQSAGVDTDPWTVAGVLTAIISGHPTAPSKVTDLDVTISGTNVTHYRYKVEETGSVDCSSATGYVPSVPGTAVGTKITQDFSSLDDGSVTLCVIGSNGAQWQDLASASTVNWIKDTTGPVPTSISINSGATYTNDDDVTLTLSATDARTPIEMYATNTSGCAAGGTWENYGTSKSWTLGQINGTATVYVKFRDSLENESSCISDTITHDAQNPNNPTGLALGSVPPSTTTTPVITFTNATDVGPSGINRHEIQIHRADNSVLQAWQTFTSGNSVTGLTLIDGQQYYAKIRAVDNATNQSSGVDTVSWTVAGSLVATISGHPTAPSKITELDVTIGGTNITHYRYKVAETGSINCSSATGYQPSVPGTVVGTKITESLAGIDDGSVTLCVIGSNGAQWQDLGSASSVTWIKDTTGPVPTSISINSGATYTNDEDVTLTLSATDARTPIQMYVTNTNGCGSGGNWEGYSTSKAWTLGQTGGTATVYVKFRDSLQNESTCISDTIMHDAQSPNNPTSLALGSVPPSTSASPVITFINATDVGPSGINRHEIQIHRADNSVLQAWQTFTSGNAVTGLTLVDGQQYYAKVRAVDNATNESSGVNTASWTVAGSLVATISGHPTGASKVTALDVTIGGTNVTHYRYKVEETGSVDCSSATGYVPIEPGTAVGTKITHNLSSLDDGSVTLCVIGSNGAQWQSLGSASSVTWTKDTTGPVPTSISINAGATYTNDDDVTLTLSATDARTPIEMYVTNVSDCGSGGSWESYNTTKSWTLGQINGTATVYAKFRDSLENESTCISDAITHDAQSPNNPTGLALGSVPPSTTTTPVITFTSAGDVGPSGINRHEIQIHRADNSVLQSWQTFTSGNAVTGLSLIDGQQYYARIRAVDNATNVSAGVNTASWTVAGSLVATISGHPTGASKVTALDVTISGTNVTHYRYKVAETDSLDCSSATGYVPSVPGTAVGTKITESFSSLDDGSVTLCVIGSNGSQWQDLASASSVTWIKDTTGPVPTSISINAGATYTNDDDVTLTLSATDARTPIQMYVTNTNGCGSGGAWESYNTSKAWTLGQTNGTATVYVKFRDSLQNESACISDTITHDSQAPNAPTGLALGVPPVSLTNSPIISWTAATDPGPSSGINRHQVQVHRADNSVLKAWADHTSGTAVTSGLALTHGDEYYFKVRAVDNAGNNGAEAQSANWTAMSSITATISGHPTGASKVTALDVTIGGTNVTHYRYKVAETDSVNCSNATGYVPAVPGTVVGTKITESLTSLDDGSVTLCVIGSNGTTWQALGSASSVNWIKDTTGPAPTTIAINAGAAYTNTTSATLTLSATDARTPIQMYVTNTNGCGSGGTWESYNTSKAWTLGQTNGAATVYVKFRDSLQNESTCISDTITHDSQAPNAPTGLALGVVPASLTSSPAISWTAATDQGPSGINRHQVQVHRADNSVLKAWADHTSGTAVTSGLALTHGDEYYFKVRAVDNAGNNGAEAQSANWTAMSSITATIAGQPLDPSDDTALDVTVGGLNITNYRFKVGLSSINCATDGGSYSSSTPVATKITADISGLSGALKLCVIGYNGSSWQAMGSATNHTWQKASPMILVVNTTGAATLPLHGTVSATVDWGDTQRSNYSTAGNRNHTYGSSGTYTIKIYGQVTQFGNGDTGYTNADKITQVTSFGDLGLVSLYGAFKDAVNLVSVPSVLPSAVVNLRRTFEGATSFNSPNISSWNVSNVTTMQQMFWKATIFNQPLSSWNIGNVTSTNAMFADAKAFNQNISSWNVSKVTNMDFMFQRAESFNQPIGNWNTIAATTMNRMFDGASSFNADIGGWKTGSVGSMSYMFYGATAFNQDLALWDTENVTSMQEMFYGATSFNGDIGAWDTSNVGNMAAMFRNATSFDQDINSWNVGSVTDMERMFYMAAAFDQDLSFWCVDQFPTEPTEFRVGANSWSQPKPRWGICPGSKTPTAPTIAIEGGADYITATSVTLTLSAVDALDMYVTNTSGCASGGTWEEYNTTRSWTLPSLNTINTVYVKYRHGENETSCVNASITHDNQNPGVVTGMVLSGAPVGLNQSPTISYTGASDNGPAGIQKHQVRIYRTTDHIPMSDWADHTSGSSVTSLSLADGVQYYARVRAIDNAGNTGSEVYSSNWTAYASIIATLSGTPASPSNATALDVTVGGVGVTGYQFKVGAAGSTNCSNSSGYSSGTTLIADKITESLTAISDGNVRLCVRGTNGPDWQDLASPTIYNWVKDASAPAGISITINGGATYTNSTSATLTLAATDDHSMQMYVTNTSGCGSGGTWESYNTSKAWNLGQTNGVATVYVRFRDSLNNTSGCTSDTITHDAQNPNQPGTISLGSVPGNLTETPTITYTAASDQGPSGINRHQARVLRNSDSLEIAGWATHTSGAKITGLSLVNGTLYRVEVRAVDNADNYGAARSRTWTASAGPTNPTISINSGASATETTLVNLTLSAVGAVEMYVTNTSGCGSGGGWESYGTSKAWTLGQTGTTATVYVKYRDSSLVESACVSDTIVHKMPSLFKQISLGAEHACALDQVGDVYCWGRNAEGEVGDGTTIQRNVATKVTFPNSEKIMEMDVGGRTTCAVAGSGNLYCWGYNSTGSIGDGTSGGSNHRYSPVHIGSGLSGNNRYFRSVSVGSGHACAITIENVAYCWGGNDYGQLGDNSTTGRYSPTLVNTGGFSGAKTWSQLAVGYDNTCGITTEGVMYCWGLNQYGEHGTGNTSQKLRPTTAVDVSGIDANTRWRSMSAGEAHICGVSAISGLGYCWGFGNRGRLGTGNTTNRTTPTLVNTTDFSAGGGTWLHIEAGTRTTCGISGNGKLACWGHNKDGSAGINNASESNILRPVEVNTGLMDGNKTFSEVAVSSVWGGGQADSACGISSDGKIFCWGLNAQGQLGHGGTSNALRPALIDTSLLPVQGEVFRKVYGGTMHSCGLTHEGKAYCWGGNTWGQLGDGTKTDRAYATEVDVSGISGDKTFKKLALSYRNTCGITTDGVPYCWGDNEHRGLGDGTTTESLVPKAVSLDNVAAPKNAIDIVSRIWGGGCLISSAGSTYCWGDNSDGAVGDNSTSSRSKPVSIYTNNMTGVRFFKQLTAGTYWICGVSVAGVGHCWGDSGAENEFLGIGASGDRTSPVPINTTDVTGEKLFTEVVSGHNFSCAKATSAHHYCWGNNGSGKLGLNYSGNQTTPKQVYTTDLSGATKFRKFQPQGTSNACGITGDGKLYCTGQANYGAIGDNNTTTSRIKPVPVHLTNVTEDDKTWTELSGGRGHDYSGNDTDEGAHSSCALLTEGAMYCWGQNVRNQIGPMTGNGIYTVPTPFNGL